LKGEAQFLNFFVFSIYYKKSTHGMFFAELNTAEKLSVLKMKK
jgi:hypothetical protein